MRPGVVTPHALDIFGFDCSSFLCAAEELIVHTTSPMSVASHLLRKKKSDAEFAPPLASRPSAAGSASSWAPTSPHKKASFVQLDDKAEGSLPPASAAAHPLQILRAFDGKPAGYGAVRFPASRRAPSRWVRLCAEAPPDVLVRLLIETFEMAPPCAVVAVVGADGTRDAFSAQHEMQFKEGLAYAAGKAGAWFVTSGAREGMASVVASALGGLADPPPIVGVMPWGAVSEQAAMAEGKNSRGQIYQYGSSANVARPGAGRRSRHSRSTRSRRLSRAQSGAFAKPKHAEETYLDLDPNHTAFLLVDDGTTGKLGGELGLRYRLLQYITANDLSHDGVRTPTLVLLTQGDLTDLKTIEQTLVDKGPVVCFTDTGGAAGEIYKFFRNASAEASEEVWGKEHCDEAAEIITHILALGTDTGYNGVPQLSFFTMPEEGVQNNELGLVLLHAILNDLPTRFMEIKLAVVWGVESILAEVLERPPTEEDDDERPGTTIALELALSRRDYQQAKFLIECGAQPKEVHIGKLFSRAPDVYHVVEETRASKISSKLCAPLSVIPGYKEHLECRETIEMPVVHPYITPEANVAQSIIPTRWTDLMMWAVCIGEHKLAQTIWSRSNDPLRAALLASQLCRRLSTQPNLAAQSAVLDDLAAQYEDLAIGLVESFGEAEDAIVSLAMVPCTFTDGCPKEMWDESPMDGAAVDDGRLSVPCKRLVAHPTAQNLLEDWFCGHYPGSRAAVYVTSSNVSIFLQALFFLLPGTLCEVMPPRVPGVARLVVERTSFGQASSARDDDEEQDVVDWGKGAAKTYPDQMNELDQRENSCIDIWEDFYSGRWYEFFNVPKVKFVAHLTTHVMYVCLMLYMGQSNAGLRYNGQLDSDVEYIEVALWIWTGAIFYAEIRQMNTYDLEGFRMYFRSVWNKLDMLNCLSILVVCAFRITCWGNHDREDAMCNAFQSWSRCLYAVTELTLVMRTLNYLTAHEGLGVLVIILSEMLANDVSLFVVLVAIVSLGTGFSFTLLMPGLQTVIDSNTQFASLPLFMPFWGLLGNSDLEVTQELGYESPSFIIVPLVLYFYLFLATVVMINLLIAQMSATYERVKAQSREEWLFARAQAILESKDEKGPIPPPLNVIKSLLNDLPKMVMYLFKLLRVDKIADRAANQVTQLADAAMDAGMAGISGNRGEQKPRVREGFKVLPKDAQMLRDWRKKEQQALRTFLEREEAASKLGVDAKISALSKRLDELEELNRTRFDQLVGFVVNQGRDREVEPQAASAQKVG